MELEGFDVLIQYLNGSKKINYGKPPSFSEKFDKNKSKNRKSENVRKRDLLLTLMREKRPDKILKLIQVFNDNIAYNWGFVYLLGPSLYYVSIFFELFLTHPSTMTA